jgi:hypothetical protein
VTQVTHNVLGKAAWSGIMGDPTGGGWSGVMGVHAAAGAGAGATPAAVGSGSGVASAAAAPGTFGASTVPGATAGFGASTVPTATAPAGFGAASSMPAAQAGFGTMMSGGAGWGVAGAGVPIGAMAAGGIRRVPVGRNERDRGGYAVGDVTAQQYRGDSQYRPPQVDSRYGPLQGSERDYRAEMPAGGAGRVRINDGNNGTAQELRGDSRYGPPQPQGRDWRPEHAGSYRYG